MNRSERTEQMLAHVAAQQSSGQSRKNYCQSNDLNLSVLTYWCKKARSADQATGFTPWEITSATGIELHYPNGVRMILPVGTSLGHVAACIRLV